MKLKMLKISVPVLMLMIFQTGSCLSVRALRAAYASSQSIKLGEPRDVVIQRTLAACRGSEGRQAKAVPVQPAPVIAQSRADADVARLKKEAERRKQQEEARAKQEAEQRRQEEEARMKREAELLRQREEIRAQQEAEVQLRMQELEDLGGNSKILSKFEKGSGNPEELQEYKAILNRADAEIVRLRKEDGLNKQSMIDQLTEENQELRDMIEQLRKRMENLEKGNQ